VNDDDDEKIKVRDDFCVKIKSKEFKGRDCWYFASQ
jgi:hypothetical protein